MTNPVRHLNNKITNLVSRGEVSAVDATGKMQRIQGSILANETKDKLEHVEPFGFTSNPRPGAEFVPIFLEGDRSNGLVLVAADRRYRITGLPSGAIAVGTPGNSIIIHPDGTITVQTQTLTVNANTMAINAPTLNIDADHINSSGEWLHDGELKAQGKSLPHHKHNETGSVTSEPV